MNEDSKKEDIKVETKASKQSSGEVPHEEVDKIDELLRDVPEWLREPLKENYKQILATIAIIIVVTVLWSGFSYYTNKQETNASYSLGLAMAQKDVNERFKALKEIVDKYSHTNAAKIANVLIGQAYLEKAEFKNALNSFKEAAPDFDGIIHDSAILGQGYALEEQKEFDKALKRYKEVSKSKNGLESIAILDEARIYKQKGQKEEAIKAFNKYLDLEPQSPFLDYIRYQVLNISS